MMLQNILEAKKLVGSGRSQMAQTNFIIIIYQTELQLGDGNVSIIDKILILSIIIDYD